MFVRARFCLCILHRDESGLRTEYYARQEEGGKKHFHVVPMKDCANEDQTIVYRQKCRYLRQEGFRLCLLCSSSAQLSRCEHWHLLSGRKMCCPYFSPVPDVIYSSEIWAIVCAPLFFQIVCL